MWFTWHHIWKNFHTSLLKSAVHCRIQASSFLCVKMWQLDWPYYFVRRQSLDHMKNKSLTSIWLGDEHCWICSFCSGVNFLTSAELFNINDTPTGRSCSYVSLPWIFLVKIHVVSWCHEYVLLRGLGRKLYRPNFMIYSSMIKVKIAKHRHPASLTINGWLTPTFLVLLVMGFLIHWIIVDVFRWPFWSWTSKGITSLGGISLT